MIKASNSDEAFHARRPSTSRWAMFSIVALVLALAPAPLRAQFRGHGAFASRGFIGGRGFVGGVRFGVGFSIGPSYVYSYPVYVTQPSVYLYSSPPPVYYVTQPAPQSVVVVNQAPPASAPPVVATCPTPPAPAVAKAGKLVYDAKGKPIGVLVLRADGSQEFVPLTQS